MSKPASSPRIQTPFTAIAGIEIEGDIAVFSAATATTSDAIYQHDLSTGQTIELKKSSSLDVDPGYLSVPDQIEFPTERGLTAYGFYYPTDEPGLQRS